MGCKPIEIDAKQVEALASRGLTLEQIASSMGFSVRTLANRKRQNSEIAEAIKNGKNKGIAKIANKLFEKAEGGDLTAMIYWLKVHAGWIEKQKIEADVTTREEVPEGATALYAKIKAAYGKE